MGLRTHKPLRRLDAQGIAQVLADVRALPVVENPTFAVSRNNILVSRLERQIYLAVVRGAHAEEHETKYGGYQKNRVTIVFDGRGNPVLTFPYCLSSIDAAWKLIEDVAPGLRINCEFLAGNKLKIISVRGPSGREICAEWPILAPAHGLTVALLEFLNSISAVLPQDISGGAA